MVKDARSSLSSGRAKSRRCRGTSVETCERLMCSIGLFSSFRDDLAALGFFQAPAWWAEGWLSGMD